MEMDLQQQQITMPMHTHTTTTDRTQDLSSASTPVVACHRSEYMTIDQLRNLPSRQLAQRIVARDQALAKRWWRVENDGISQAHEQSLRAKAHALQQEMLRQDEDAWLVKHQKLRTYHFSKEQRRKLRRWFDTLDSNKNGRISIDELQDPMLSIGIVCDTNEIRDLVQRIDTDSSGTIDFNEFVQFLTPHPYVKNGNAPNALEKHEHMFQQLTQQMEHQSDGVLDIHTQLSMERRRFILEAITTRFDERLGSTRRTLMTRSTPELHNVQSHGTSPSPKNRNSMSMAAIWANKKRKLDPVHVREMTNHRLHALEEMLTRNDSLAVRRTSSPDLSGDTSLAAARNSLRLMPLSSLAPATPRSPLPFNLENAPRPRLTSLSSSSSSSTG